MIRVSETCSCGASMSVELPFPTTPLPYAMSAWQNKHADCPKAVRGMRTPTQVTEVKLSDDAFIPREPRDMRRMGW